MGSGTDVTIVMFSGLIVMMARDKQEPGKKKHCQGECEYACKLIIFQRLSHYVPSQQEIHDPSDLMHNLSQFAGFLPVEAIPSRCPLRKVNLRQKGSEI
jgi:hypothetical protein